MLLKSSNAIKLIKYLAIIYFINKMQIRATFFSHEIFSIPYPFSSLTVFLDFVFPSFLFFIPFLSLLHCHTLLFLNFTDVFLFLLIFLLLLSPYHPLFPNQSPFPSSLPFMIFQQYFLLAIYRPFIIVSLRKYFCLLEAWNLRVANVSDRHSRYVAMSANKMGSSVAILSSNIISPFSDKQGEWSA